MDLLIFVIALTAVMVVGVLSIFEILK